MFNIRFPINNIYLLKLVQYKHYSSGFTHEAYQQLLKYVTNQDKIKTEQFRQILPYLKNKDNDFHNYFNDTIRESILNTKLKKENVPNISELTNIIDILPETEKTEPQSRNVSTAQVNQSLNSIDSPSLLNSENTVVVEKRSPQALPANLVPTSVRDPVYLADLSNASLPLSIHRTDNSSLVAKHVQDVNNVFFTLLEMVDKWMIQTNKQGQHLYKAMKELNDGRLRQQVTELILYRNNSALQLCEKKDAVAKKDEKSEPTSSSSSESIVDKIKKVIEGILATLKKKLEEQKQKKKEENK